MTIAEAIHKAIDADWKKTEQPDLSINNDGCWVQFFSGGNTTVIHQAEIFLTPSFWQALGKAMGWTDLYIEFVKPGDEGKILEPNAWRNQWHLFIDHLAESGTPDSFFAELK